MLGQGEQNLVNGASRCELKRRSYKSAKTITQLHGAETSGYSRQDCLHTTHNLHYVISPLDPQSPHRKPRTNPALCAHPV